MTKFYLVKTSIVGMRQPLANVVQVPVSVEGEVENLREHLFAEAVRLVQADAPKSKVIPISFVELLDNQLVV